jgi:hypothetical protein
MVMTTSTLDRALTPKCGTEGSRTIEVYTAVDSIVTICANCRKIRDLQGHWNHVKINILDNTETKFSHGMCPECMEILYPQFHEVDAKREENVL